MISEARTRTITSNFRVRHSFFDAPWALYDRIKVLQNTRYCSTQFNKYHIKGEQDEKTDIIPAGAVIRVTTAGIKNYKGNISNTFVVAENGTKNLKFIIDPSKEYYYTGKAIAPGKDDIKLQRKEGRNWVDIPAEEAASYYDIIGYKNNIKPGTGAQIIIRTKNGFAGDVTVKFKIQKKSLQ